MTRFEDAYGDGNFTGLGLVSFERSYSPGEGAALVTAEGSLALGAANRLDLQLGGTALGTGYDHLTVANGLSFGGDLFVTAIGGFMPTSGQSFDLFDFGTATGTFRSVALPSLDGGLTWDTSALYTTGVIRTQAVPEPATLAALGLGALALLRRRRRA
ncbi:PEP-CTERM sorting domain-containing protein [bacterium]|nr:MAG: PEP-CTERM sorting domain-containing protein [bacterium]